MSDIAKISFVSGSTHNLSLEVAALGLNVVPDTREVGPLHVSVEVDLDDTVRDGLTEVIDGATATAVEDEEDGLVVLGASLLLDVCLVLLQELGADWRVGQYVFTRL